MNRREPASWMWSEACRLLDQAERLHRGFFAHANTNGQPTAPTWAPPVDVFEDEHRVEVAVALPGVAGGHIRVALDDGMLVVRAERLLPIRGRALRVRRLEIPYGRFERHIPMPRGQLRLAGHGLVDGCLVVVIEKSNNRELR